MAIIHNLTYWAAQRWRTGHIFRKEDNSMPTYILLMKLTEHGVKDIKNAPERIEEGIKGWEAMGGKLTSFYTVMGEYDYVAIGEAPSDEVAMTFLVRLGALGNVRTTTFKAFTKEEFAEIVKKLP
jgi:uncharacterized protein with GYD domain